MNISVSENLLAGYNATVGLLSSRFLLLSNQQAELVCPIPKAHIVLDNLKLLDDHLDYYYRATYAAHIGCNRFTERTFLERWL